MTLAVAIWVLSGTITVFWLTRRLGPWAEKAVDLSDSESETMKFCGMVTNLMATFESRPDAAIAIGLAFGPIGLITSCWAELMLVRTSVEGWWDKRKKDLYNGEGK